MRAALRHVVAGSQLDRGNGLRREGVWWLGGDLSDATAHAAELKGESAAALREFTAGSAEGFVKRFNPFGGATVLTMDGDERLRAEWTVARVAGVDRPKVDLRKDDAVGPAYPELLVEHADGALLVVRSHTHDHMNLTVHAMGDSGSEEAGAVSVQTCGE